MILMATIKLIFCAFFWFNSLQQITYLHILHTSFKKKEVDMNSLPADVVSVMQSRFGLQGRTNA
jgi:hypothetical protein